MKEDYNNFDFDLVWDEKNQKRERFRRKNQKDFHSYEGEKDPSYYYSRDDDIKELKKIISSGEEIKTNDIELVKTITKENKIKKKVGIYYYNGYILEIKSVENKKIFFIREKDESRIR